MSRRLLLLFFAIFASLRSLLPLTAQTVYATVWGNPKYVVGSSTLNSGLYESTDMGRTWRHLGPLNLKAFSMDGVDSSHGRILYIAAGDGVHRTEDFGRTWKIVTDWRMTEVLDVAVDQSSPQRVYAATAFGLWESGDGGDTWTPAPLGERYVARIDAYEEGIVAVVEDTSLSAGTAARWTRRRDGRWTVLGRGPWPPIATIDSVSAMAIADVSGVRLAATWGRGVLRSEGSGWTQSGLDGSQVWDIVVKEYR
jgi:hypothetical protein